MYELIHSDDPQTAERERRWGKIEFKLGVLAPAVFALFIFAWALFGSSNS